MSTLRELFPDSPASPAAPRVTPIREQATRPPAGAKAGPVHDQQIHALVQQLFLGRESKPVRHVAFAGMEASAATAHLCLEVAQVLAEEDRYDIGLIDANCESTPLQSELRLPPANRTEGPWLIAPRLWMVPRQSWLPHAAHRRLTDQDLSRLRELTTEFDFSILWCAPVSWLTTGISQTCDGLVLVLSAHKTRRLMAAQIKDQLSKAQVPLLGTVLAGRRFPVPQGLYRSL